MRTDKTLTLTIPQAAEILGISTGLAYTLVRKKVIPVLILGNRKVVSRIKLEEFIKTGV